MIKEALHVFWNIFGVGLGIVLATAVFGAVTMVLSITCSHLMAWANKKNLLVLGMTALLIVCLWVGWCAAIITTVTVFIPEVHASVPQQSVGFRVERTGKNFAIVRPIYPMKLGGEVEGTQPKDGELLTCSVRDEEQKVEVTDSKGQTKTVSRMVIECMNGTKIRVIGVEY